MNPKDLLDDMYEVLIAIKKTGAFADLQDWNQELADERVCNQSCGFNLFISLYRSVTFTSSSASS
jgi:hypothetical protein